MPTSSVLTGGFSPCGWMLLTAPFVEGCVSVTREVGLCNDLIGLNQDLNKDHRESYLTKMHGAYCAHCPANIAVHTAKSLVGQQRAPLSNRCLCATSLLSSELTLKSRFQRHMFSSSIFKDSKQVMNFSTWDELRRRNFTWSRCDILTRQGLKVQEESSKPEISQDAIWWPSLTTVWH